MKKYYYLINEEKNGPLTLDELKKVQIKPNTLIWHEGLEDWIEANKISELNILFELDPPPIDSEKEEINPFKNDELDTENRNLNNISGSLHKKASTGWIIAGFVFAILGGFIGIGMGIHYARGNYNKETKRLGWIMLVVGVIFMSIWKSIK